MCEWDGKGKSVSPLVWTRTWHVMQVIQMHWMLSQSPSVTSYLDSVHSAQQGPGDWIPTGLTGPAFLALQPLSFTLWPQGPSAGCPSTWSARLPFMPTYLLLSLQPHFQESPSEPRDWSGFLVFPVIAMGHFSSECPSWAVMISCLGDYLMYICLLYCLLSEAWGMGRLCLLWLITVSPVLDLALNKYLWKEWIWKSINDLWLILW